MFIVKTFVCCNIKKKKMVMHLTLCNVETKIHIVVFLEHV